MSQLADTGDVTIDNNGTGGAIRLLNGSVSEMTAASNVRLNLLDNSSTNVTVDFDSALSGNLILFMRHGMRDVMFTGSDNSIGGFVRIEAALGVQNVNLAVNADLTVGNDLLIDLRTENDTVDDGANNLSIGRNLVFRSVNLFENTNTMMVAGDMRMVSVHEVQNTRLDNDGTMNIDGFFIYLGG